MESKSIDESMILYYGIHGSRQRIKNKSIQEGYKTWVLADPYGYVVQFEQYEGAKKGKKVVSSNIWELGKNIFLRLIECIHPIVSYHIVMDNYFTSFRLLIHLGVNNIWATDVLNKSRLNTNALTLRTKGAWRFWTAHIKRKSSITLTVVD